MSVQQVGRQKKVVQNVNLAKPEVSAASKVNHATTVLKITIVRVKRVMVSPLQIQEHVLSVPEVGPQSQAALNAKHVALERMVMDVSPVSWVTQGMAPIPTRLGVGSANLVRRRRQKDRPLVKNAMLVLMETQRDSARSVPQVTFKMAKENKW